MDKQDPWKITRNTYTNCVFLAKLTDETSNYLYGSFFYQSNDYDKDSYVNWDLGEMAREKHLKILERKILGIPLSRGVQLVQGDHVINVLILKDRFSLLCELLENFGKGKRLVSREEKYRNFYQVFEALSREPDPELRAIRHSLSHTRKKLTDKKTSLILLSLFGDLKIDLTKYKHAKIFRKKLDVLQILQY